MDRNSIKRLIWGLIVIQLIEIDFRVSTKSWLIAADDYF